MKLDIWTKRFGTMHVTGKYSKKCLKQKGNGNVVASI